MPSRKLTRRTFLQQSSAAAAIVGTTALAARSAPGANDRISIGMVGVGDRGSQLMSQILGLAKSHNVEITAVCDVWKVNLGRAAERVKKATDKEPRTFTRFADLTALKDVDAVVIAPPDFAHGPVLVEALKAGKDAYVEKPMTMHVADANAALELARSNHRIVQAGTQYRSSGLFRAAAKELASCPLGHISRIAASANFNQPRWARNFNNCKAEDVDWEAFLFNRPQRPFDAKLLRRWHLFREFTNGLSGLWMSHYIDVVHLLTGAKHPVSAVALGGVYVWKDGRQTTDTFHTIIEYPEGFLFDWGMSLGNSAGNHMAVFGTDGMLDIGTNYLSPQSLALSKEGGGKDSKLEAKTIAPEPTKDHMANWLECVRSRQAPNADIEYGHQHAVATIMAGLALETGRRQKYDPQKREIYAG